MALEANSVEMQMGPFPLWPAKIQHMLGCDLEAEDEALLSARNQQNGWQRLGRTSTETSVEAGLVGTRWVTLTISFPSSLTRGLEHESVLHIYPHFAGGVCLLRLGRLSQWSPRDL